MELIARTQSAGVLTLTLNRPEALNAMSLETWDELGRALEAADADPAIRALVLTGAGRAFSAGGDVKQMTPDRTPAEQRGRLDLINRVIERLYGFRCPTIAAVNGIAAGNGCSLALACDFVLAARGAMFSMSFVRLGLVPDAGGTWLLPRLVGERRAKELIMTARRLSAEEALAWGLVSQLVDDDAPGSLLGAAEALARQLADGPAAALRLGKQLVHAAPAASFAEALRAEALAQGNCVAEQDYREGVAAFLEKRQPRFRP
ncbi:MAG TPA: enoyl-CoA hydratase-related protein [Herpetosiphonaceae bacterium]